MISSADSELTDLKASTLKSLDNVLDGEKYVALLDFPSHMNVGDSMIWAGELAYLKALGVGVRYSCDIERFSIPALRKAHPEGPILLHGGGNFGDIWPRFQEFREAVIQAFPDRKIVQLPQTLYFKSRDGFRRADRVLGGHADLTVLLRDENSISRAKELLPSVRTQYVPDMAIGWTPVCEPSAGSRGVLLLARQDAESTGNVAGLAKTLSSMAQVQAEDWGLQGAAYLQWKLSRMPGSVLRRSTAIRDSGLATRVVERGYERMLSLNLQAGLQLFSNRKLIVTDRLHAHVLAALMGIPHIVLDNSYGKVRSIFENYSGRFDCAHFASSPLEAVAIAETLLATPLTP